MATSSGDRSRRISQLPLTQLIHSDSLQQDRSIGRRFSAIRRHVAALGVINCRRAADEERTKLSRFGGKSAIRLVRAKCSFMRRMVNMWNASVVFTIDTFSYFHTSSEKKQFNALGLFEYAI